jgi:putative transposase
VSVYPFLEAENVSARNVSTACALLSVSRSAYSEWHHHVSSTREVSDAELGDAIVRIHGASRLTYGSPRITAALRRGGILVGRKRVARLMVHWGLAGRGKRALDKDDNPRSVGPRQHAPPSGTGLCPRDLGARARLVGDITYIRTHEGWLFLATTIDLASRRVVGSAMADHMRASLGCDALAMALELRHPAPGFVVHTDRGSQGGFRAILVANGLVQSLSRPRQCWDNTVAKSFFATLKEELVHRQTFPTEAAARRAIFEFIEVFYNRSRLHSTLNYRTPAEYEEERRKPSKARAA